MSLFLNFGRLAYSKWDFVRLQQGLFYVVSCAVDQKFLAHFVNEGAMKSQMGVVAFATRQILWMMGVEVAAFAPYCLIENADHLFALHVRCG